jgi:hypothetical protein
MRRLMVAVAVAALGSTGWQAWARRPERSYGFYRLALVHGRKAELYTIGGRANCFGMPGEAINPRRAAYHSSLAWKYEWAGRHPWLPVWPDPPEPE